LAALRARGLASAPAPESDVLGYAKAWRYSHVVELGDNGAQLTDVVLGDNESLPRDARVICERIENQGARNER